MKKHDVKLQRYLNLLYGLFLFLLCITLTGCFWMSEILKLERTDPFETRLIVAPVEEKEKHIGTVVSLGANRRAMIIKPDSRFCAEPPPDVASSITDEIITNFEASLEAGEVDAQTVAKFYSNFSENITALGARTELLEVYRAGVYAICQYHLNGGLSNEQLSDIFYKFTKGILTTLYRKEIEIDNSNVRK